MDDEAANKIISVLSKVWLLRVVGLKVRVETFFSPLLGASYLRLRVYS